MLDPLAPQVLSRHLDLSRDFPSEEAFREYLHEHPHADKTRHRVVEKEDPKTDPEEVLEVYKGISSDHMKRIFGKNPPC